MGCPVHIWVPLMAALAPAARIARDRFLASKPAPAAREVRTLRRFAPVSAQPASAPAEAASTTEQPR